MNLLGQETSPYLLQHAANPVHWFPWGDAAFEKAQAENKPILVSIGYSSCHWCHVMEHESFENQETAELMNALFVNIKVDREEYPDVDHMYMDAVQAMTGSGGWPLNVFLTPDKKPFYGGTYFPPVRAFNRASWKEILVNVSQYFTQNREEVEKQALQLTNHLTSASKLGVVEQNSNNIDEALPEIDMRKLVEKVLANADKQEGGFGTAPKFPSTFAIKLLLDHYALTGHSESLDQALLSLDKMRMGGIYDHIGGGFARYSTDKFWLAPHFEKMLYDNALLIEVYAIAFSITKKEIYKNTITEIVEWLSREMTFSDQKHKGIGFYSAQDADSEGVEGKYYTWSYEELEEILKGDFQEFAEYFNLKEEGNWEHTNILHEMPSSKEHVSPVFLEKLTRIKQELLEIRSMRIRPLTDDKILLGWNALMNKALTNAGLLTEEKGFIDLAQQNMHFMLENFKSEAHLYYHTYKNGLAKIPAFADDFAYLADALISLANATGNAVYLDRSKEITNYLLKNFKAENAVLLDFANHQFQQVEINKREIYDGAMPSPNAIFCSVLGQLSTQLNMFEWSDKASRMLDYMRNHCQHHPSSFAIWSSLWQVKQVGEVEVKVEGDAAFKIVMQLHNKGYKPNVKYSITGEKGKNLKQDNEQAREGETRIVICKNQVCHKPIIKIDDAIALIF